MNLYLDDLRTPPNTLANGQPIKWDFVARTAEDAINILNTHEITFVSFDHDLGPTDQTGYTVAKWIEEQAFTNPNFKPLTYAVHSANPEGARRIKLAMESALRAWANLNEEKQGIE